MNAPCRHLDDFAAVTNFHDGHCCFWPASQDCHPAEVAEWERRARELRTIPPAGEELPT